jgi:hypothetical protein
MTRLTGFPPNLLERPATERLAYFENYTVAHPRLKEAYEILMRTIAEPAGASLMKRNILGKWQADTSCKIN